jgi:DNA repair protein SbcC/Rad50
MLQSIELKDFQSHKSRRLELHPGVNSIVGPSDSGKSAIVRALLWLITNRPLGEGFVSHWNRTPKGGLKEETSATAVLDNGVIISRARSKDFNGYRIGERELEAIRADIPEEVVSQLNFGEVNIQRQMDAPFLLSESPGEVARFFNRTIKLDLIDSLLTLIESRRREFAREGKRVEEEVERLIEKQGGFSWVEGAEKLVGKARSLKEKTGRDREEREILEQRVEEYRLERTTVRRTGKWLDSVVPKFEKTERLGRSITERSELLRLLKSDLSAWQAASTIVESGGESIEKATAILKKVDTLTERIAANRREAEYLDSTLEVRETAISDVAIEEDQITSLEASLPDTCPLCGGPLTNHKENHG